MKEGFKSIIINPSNMFGWKDYGIDFKSLPRIKSFSPNAPLGHRSLGSARIYGLLKSFWCLYALYQFAFYAVQVIILFPLTSVEATLPLPPRYVSGSLYLVPSISLIKNNFYLILIG